MYYIQIPPKQPTWSCNGSCFPMSSIRGAIKMHIPASAFARCGTEKPPANILLSHVNAWPLDVSFENMKYYLPLILAMFDISPEGTNISKKNKYTLRHVIVFCRFYHVTSISASHIPICRWFYCQPLHRCLYAFGCWDGLQPLTWEVPETEGTVGKGCGQAANTYVHMLCSYACTFSLGMHGYWYIPFLAPTLRKLTRCSTFFPMHEDIGERLWHVTPKVLTLGFVLLKMLEA